ncbi:hypothetical protein T492DRAFT_908438 [Pavlovales sp. CCMP2436]|nr:hypothetical protein T492DRAFT_908438 [Pavlovales sp. CCMP2436]
MLLMCNPPSPPSLFKKGELFNGADWSMLTECGPTLFPHFLLFFLIIFLLTSPDVQPGGVTRTYCRKKK